MNITKAILVVDDNKVNRSILEKILSKDGYEVLQAENGKVAFDILCREKEKISLVLLDLSMPVMNGYELLAKMNETGIIHNVPVIVTTGSEDGKAEIKSLESGASDFIVKPYNAELYNGPRTSDHRKKKDREHGRIEITGRSDHPCHEEATQRNSRPRLYWRCWRVPENWKPSQQIIS